MPRLIGETIGLSIIALTLLYNAVNKLREYGYFCPDPKITENHYTLSLRLMEPQFNDDMTEFDDYVTELGALARKNHIKSVVSRYVSYIEMELGNKVIKRWDPVDSETHYLTIQLDETPQLLEALGERVSTEDPEDDRDRGTFAGPGPDKKFGLYLSLFGNLELKDLHQWDVDVGLWKCYWPYIPSSDDPTSCVTVCKVPVPEGGRIGSVVFYTTNSMDS